VWMVSLSRLAAAGAVIFFLRVNFMGDGLMVIATQRLIAIRYPVFTRS
jgi:hypothetical protein